MRNLKYKFWFYRGLMAFFILFFIWQLFWGEPSVTFLVCFCVAIGAFSAYYLAEFTAGRILANKIHQDMKKQMRQNLDAMNRRFNRDR